MAKRRMLRLLPAFVLILLVASQVSFADSHARIVRLSEIEGSVQIDRNTGQGFEKAILNMPITEGMRLSTSAGRAEVEFENGSVLRLADHSAVEFSQLSLHDDGQQVNQVRVNSGMVYVNFKSKGGNSFRLDFAKDTLELDRDVHFRLRVSPENEQISVFKGELNAPENGEIAKLKKDQTLNIDLNNSPQYELAKGVTGLAADRWDSERTGYETQYQDQFGKSKYPYQYGYSDLSYYGTFFNAPGYGTMWQPFGVTAGWDPFTDGAWAYTPSFGYMWVSGYPWGWTPYRYGNWMYSPAYGWAWQPGGWNTLNAYPTVLNAPKSWHHPVPPAATSLHSTVLVGNAGNPAMVRSWHRMAMFQQPNAAMTSGVVRTRPATATATAAGPVNSAMATAPATSTMPSVAASRSTGRVSRR